MSKGPVASTRLRYADYVCIPNDGRRHEIVDGDHFVNPAPSTYHQTVSKRLQYQLYTQIELRGFGLVFNAPVDLQLSEFDIVQPDLVVVLNAKKTIITPTKIKGIADLVVEITSPSTADYDQVLKRTLYQRTGVPEYWIVDTEEHVLTQLVLTNGAYVARPAADVVQPTVVDDVLVRLLEVW